MRNKDQTRRLVIALASVVFAAACGGATAPPVETPPAATTAAAAPVTSIDPAPTTTIPTLITVPLTTAQPGGRYLAGSEEGMLLFFGDIDSCHLNTDHEGQGACFVELGRNIAESFEGAVPPSWQVDMCGTAPVEHRGGCVDSLIRHVLQGADSLDAAFEVCDAVGSYLGSESGIESVLGDCWTSVLDQADDVLSEPSQRAEVCDRISEEHLAERCEYKLLGGLRG